MKSERDGIELRKRRRKSERTENERERTGHEKERTGQNREGEEWNFGE